MPTALQRSRDIMAQGVARLRSSFAELDRRQGETGPEIAVQPFDAANVSTPAALIKLGTSIAAARRKRANFEAAREGQALEREKTKAEIEHLRARAVAELREPAAAKPTPTMTKGRLAGLTYGEANVLLRDEGLAQSAAATASRERRAGKVASARAGLSELDKAVPRDAEVHAARQMRRLEHVFKRAVSPDPKVRDVALAAIDITPEQWERAGADPANNYQPNLLSQARAKLRAKVVANARMHVEQYYRPQREEFNSTIQQGLEGFVPGAAAGESEIIEVDDQGNPVQ